MARPSKRTLANKLFAKIVRSTRKYFEKQGQSMSYREAQRYVSENLYPLFKGQKHYKVRVKDIIKAIEQIQKPSSSKKKQICGDVFNVPLGDISDINWWDIEEALLNIDPIVNARLNTQGTSFTTSIKTVSEIVTDAETKDLISEIRAAEQNLSGRTWVGLRKLKPNAQDDGSPCSYFIDFVLSDENGEVDESEAIDRGQAELSEEELQRKEARAKEVQRLLRERKKKKGAKKRARPQQKTAKVSAPEGESTKSDAPRIEALNRTLELLRKDFDDGILTKAEYKKDRAKIISRFEKGGEI